MMDEQFNPTRYKVTFNFLANSKPPKYYDVCTCFGKEKAVVLATQKHNSTKGSGNIYRVSSVELLPGSGPEGNDIVDRMEW